MSATPAEIAAAFSGHRFGEAYPHLAGDVRRVLADGLISEITSYTVEPRT